MRLLRSYSIVPVVLFFVVLSAALHARTQEQEVPSHEERAKAINVVRMLNTAEVTYSSKQAQAGNPARFVSWEELYQSGILKPMQERWGALKEIQLSDGPEIIPGYHLDLLVAADGQSYSIALHDKKEGDRLFSVFSDQTGIIYLGAPLQ